MWPHINMRILPTFKGDTSVDFKLFKQKLEAFFKICAPKSITNSVEINKCLQHKNKTNI